MVIRPRHVLEGPGPDPEVGRWLAALDDARSRTLRELDTVEPDHVDMVPDGPLGSIGSLLYHVALIEADWVAFDILGLEEPAELAALLPWPDRTADGRLTPVTGLLMAAHVERLAAVRAFTHAHLDRLSSQALVRVRAMPDYDVAPVWAIHHLLQHEAEHRTHIAWIRDVTLAGRPPGTP